MSDETNEVSERKPDKSLQEILNGIFDDVIKEAKYDTPTFNKLHDIRVASITRISTELDQYIRGVVITYIRELQSAIRSGFNDLEKHMDIELDKIRCKSVEVLNENVKEIKELRKCIESQYNCAREVLPE